MRGVGEREEIRDSNGADAVEVAETDQFLSEPLLIQRDENRAILQDALWNADAARTWNEVLWLDPVKIEVVRARHTLDAKDVPETVGREQRDLGTLPLDEGVGGNRRSMHEVADVFRVEIALRERAEDRFRRLSGRREHLGHPKLTRLVVERDEVGERPARVDSCANRHASPSIWWLLPGGRSY